MTDEQFDRLIWEAMVSLGWIIPTTPKAVEIAERAIEDDSIPLPDRLRMPPSIDDAVRLLIVR